MLEEPLLFFKAPSALIGPQLRTQLIAGLRRQPRRPQPLAGVEVGYGGDAETVVRRLRGDPEAAVQKQRDPVAADARGEV
jgi:hypothetical protein